MPYCTKPEPPRRVRKDTEAEKKQKVERQFRRISEPKASWVLVTGFPPSATDRILITFRSVGRIVGQQWSTDGLQLQFSNLCESARAVELDKLCIAGYPVRITAIPSTDVFPSCPLRLMGDCSNRIMCREDIVPCYLGFCSTLQRAFYIVLDIVRNTRRQLVRQYYAYSDYIMVIIIILWLFI